jgi:type I restriction enzyme M protein
MTVMAVDEPPDDSEWLLRVWRKSGVSLAELPLALATLIYLRWADFQEAEREAVNAFEGVEHASLLPGLLHWRAWHDLPRAELVRLLKIQLAPALGRLGNHRQDALATNLHRLADHVERLSRFAPSLLAIPIDWLSLQPFETPSDRRRLLAIFDSVLDQVQDKSAGEHRTPRHIINLMVALAAPRPGERVYDPCFGTAGLLSAAFEWARDQETSGISGRTGTPISISGIEINETSYLIGLTRLMLAGVDEPQLELADSLERPRGGQGAGFDLVLANPPWGVHLDRERYLRRYPIPTGDATGLFVQHSLDQLRPNGRAVIIVPEGFLFQAGLQELRRMLTELNTIDAVVSLPPGIFLPYTGVKSSLVLLRRDGPTRQVRMVDASQRDTGQQRSPQLSFHEIAAIVASVRAPDGSTDAWDVPIQTLSKLDWELTVRRRDTGSLYRMLEALELSYPIVPVQTVCRVIPGRVIPSRELQKRPGDDPLVPYIRIGDLRDGRANRATSWLIPSAAAPVDPKQKLLPGDVLISKSGTIGKVAIVQNGAVGGIASQGLLVLRVSDDRLDPHFLAAYLESEACRTWFIGLSQGVTIQHLLQRAITDLSVPIPPLPLQRRVAEEHRAYGVDAIAYLTEVAGRGDRDPVAEWAIRTLRSMFPEHDAAVRQLDLAILDLFANDARRLRNQVAHHMEDGRTLAGWMMAFADAVEPLRGLDKIPPGTLHYGAFQEALQKVNSAAALLRGSGQEEASARQLTLAVARQLRYCVDELVGEIRITLAPVGGKVDAGTAAEVGLLVRNDGRLPIRDVQLTTTPNWGTRKVALLGEAQSATFILQGDAPKRPGAFAIVCEWLARGIDGRQFGGRIEVPLLSVEPAQEPPVPMLELAASPYVCGDPVRPDRHDVFFGRDELVDAIRRQVIQSGNVILLEGNRRAGKSSILRHLEGLVPIEGWLGVYCSLQGAEGSPERVGVPTVEVFREIAKSVASSLQILKEDVPLPDRSVIRAGQVLGVARASRAGISEESPFSDCREYVEVALAHLKPHGLGILLMLDEFDKLQEGIDSGVTSPQVPENIRFLVQTYPRFSAILTGSRRLKRLRDEYWSALFGLGTRFSVTALSEDAARRLVTEPVRSKLTFSNEAVTRAVKLVACQPFLLQCLCSRIFELAAQLKQRSIMIDLVDRAADVLVADNEHFASLWDYAATDRRRLILAVCKREAAGPDALRLGVLEERLTRLGVEVDESRLESDLEDLRELEVLDKGDEASGGAYTLTIPLMGQWIDRQQDFDILVSRARSQTEDEHA